MYIINEPRPKNLKGVQLYNFENPIATKNGFLICFDDWAMNNKNLYSLFKDSIFLGYYLSLNDAKKTAQKMEDIQEKIFACENREEKKNLLRELSQIAKFRIELNGTDQRINEALIEMYSTEEHTEFNTFKGWKEKGFSVKKGEKGFFVWSKKLKATEKTESSEEDKEFKFFGIAHIFSNAQIEPSKK